jgi:ribosomal-protein-alanine N-acetyltransferase
MSARSEAVHPLIRRLNERDLDRVIQIEEAAYPYPWTRGIFADCLRVGYECWGLQIGETLAGYTIQSQAAGENHLLNLCVAREHQRRGLGAILLDHAIRLARRQGCFCVFLEVRPSNTGGLALYRKNGFKVISERPEYYRSDHGREAAIVMQLELKEQPPA